MSTINFYDQTGDIDSITIIERINNDVADKNLIKANALFVEPLSKKFFWETFYNFSNRVESGERTVLDIVDFDNTINPFLSREYENTLLYNRIGSRFAIKQGFSAQFDFSLFYFFYIRYQYDQPFKHQGRLN